ncbi:MAG: hypothetical protein HQK55_07780, partial [Deltaproteobacteria bacterium]|nr:hypothetical protein [Deltaproteobacteria bacterium]
MNLDAKPVQIKPVVISPDPEQLPQRALRNKNHWLNSLSRQRINFASRRRIDDDLFEQHLDIATDLIMVRDMMKAVLKISDQSLPDNEKITKKTAVIATVKGDFQDLGKNILGTLLLANGYMVHDLGREVNLSKVITTAGKLKSLFKEPTPTPVDGKLEPHSQCVDSEPQNLVIKAEGETRPTHWTPILTFHCSEKIKQHLFCDSLYCVFVEYAG